MTCDLLRLMTSSEANSDLSIHLREKAWPLWLLKIPILPIRKTTHPEDAPHIKWLA